HFLTYCYHLTGIVIDKLAHFLMYFAVCGALWIALPARFYHIPSPLWAFLIATLWGLLMEVLQGVLTSLHIISRAFDLHDAVANLLGAAAASLCTSTLMLLWRHHHSTQNR
ncbi:MAG: VanZ family protein, partial [Kiritimatiellae bacterium]|nr:VanZ family protein [Kiritimatiellia bacterium]